MVTTVCVRVCVKYQTSIQHTELDLRILVLLSDHVAGFSCAKTSECRSNVNDARNTFYLRLYGDRHIMVKDHSDSERKNLMLTTGATHSE